MSTMMTHLNGNLLCAIDTETTGLITGKHDIIQICVLPLDSNLQILRREGLFPFYTYLQPKRPENADPKAMQVNGLKLADLMVNGIDPYKAADLFDEWMKKLGLAYNKKIAPLGCNYHFDQEFMRDWLGDVAYEQYFDYHVRDVQSAALYLNDKADFSAETVPFPKTNLRYLCSQLGVNQEGAHDALQDCIATAEVWRRMVMGQLGL